jgi:uncharacterized protein DUF6516
VWATERLLEIEQRFGPEIERSIPLDLDGHTLRLILYLQDGTNLRLTEQWNGNVLERYSYCWLTAANELKIGWDNAPHQLAWPHFPSQTSRSPAPYTAINGDAPGGSHDLHTDGRNVI